MTFPSRSIWQRNIKWSINWNSPNNKHCKAAASSSGWISARNPSLPRFTPTTGSWFPPINLAERRIEPSPPNTIAKSADWSQISELGEKLKSSPTISTCSSITGRSCLICGKTFGRRSPEPRIIARSLSFCWPG